MADRANQHFVPKFYFRNFSTDGCTIGSLLIRDGRVIDRAPIKGQCARKNFYGSKELESLFSDLESQHSLAIIAALDVANNQFCEPISHEEYFRFLQAVMFQRSRTALEIDKSESTREQFLLELFKQYVKSSKNPRSKEMSDHIAAGNVSIKEPPHVTVCRSIRTALDCVMGITDLSLCLIRNRTDFPFIFSDAPVVFYNSYCRRVRNRGVLGVQCPSLQIFFPLDPWTLALLFDADKYSGSFKEYLQYDTYSRSDVSQMNVLQMHHALNVVYFRDTEHREYVQDLWNTHRHSFRPIKDQLNLNADFWVDGKPIDGQLIHKFEPQVGFDLSLSFMQCEPISQHEYQYQPRSAEIRDEMKRMHQELLDAEEA